MKNKNWKPSKKEQKERDAYMAKQIAAAIKWARKEIARVKKEGLVGSEQADYILAEVGRRFNIGAMNAVEKEFKLVTTEEEGVDIGSDWEEDDE